MKENNVSIARIVGASAHTNDTRQQHDFYATDPKAAQDFLSAFIDRDNQSLQSKIWEPACGDGALSEVLKAKGYEVLSSDLIDRGYPGAYQQDLLSSDSSIWEGDVVTNPPYKLAQKFIEKCLSKVSDGSKVIMLVRLQFLEGKARKEWFSKTPPKFVYVHSSRIGIYKNNDRENYKNANPLAFAWFVWTKGHTGDTTVKWI